MGVSHRYTLTGLGTKFTRKGKAFRKEVLREGWYQQPVHEWDEPLELSRADILLIVDESNRAIENGNRVWIPVGHTDDPEKNRGYVERFEAAESPDDPALLSVYAVLDIRNSKTADRILSGEIADVSVELAEVGDGIGNEYGPRIVHVALVNFPIFAGQGDFVALGARGGTRNRVALAYAGVLPMKRIRTLGTTATLKTARPKRLLATAVVRKAAKALGVPLDKRVRQKDLEALAEKMLAGATKGATGVGAATKALSRAADATFKDLCTERAARIETEVKALLETGRVTKDAVEPLKALLSVAHGFSLSAEGAAAESDVPALVRKVLGVIPEHACVPLDQRIKQMSVAGGRPPTTPPAFDAKADREARIAALKTAQ